MSEKRGALLKATGSDPRTLQIAIYINEQERHFADATATTLGFRSAGALGRALFRILAIARGEGPAPTAKELEALGPLQRALGIQIEGRSA